MCYFNNCNISENSVLFEERESFLLSDAHMALNDADIKSEPENKLGIG